MATNSENTPARRLEDYHPDAKIDWSKPGAPAVPLSSTVGAAKGGITNDNASPDLSTTAAQPLDLDRLEALAKAATRGPWKRSDRLNGPFWHISSEYTIDGEPCKSGRQSIGSIHAENKRGAPKYAAMFEANASFVAEFNPATALALIAQARAAWPKREMPPEMKAAIEEAHKTGATGALLPDGSAVFINHGHDYGDNDHLCCTACGGSGHIEDQQARAARLDTTASTSIECKACEGSGYIETGIDEAPTRQCRKCDGTGRATLAPVAAQQADMGAHIALLQNTVDHLNVELEETRSYAAQQAAAKAPIKPLKEERADFEDWFMGRFDEPIQSRECARQWSAWLARSTGEYKARDGWKVSPQPWGIDAFPVAAKAPAAQAVDALEGDLLPCPFCGSSNISAGEQSTTDVAGETVVQSVCMDCGGCGPGAALDVGEIDYGDVKSSAAWNRRAASPASTPEASQQGDTLPVVLEMPEGDQRTARVVWSEVKDGKRHLCIVVSEASQQAAAVAAPSEPVAYVTGSDTVIGRESRGLQWIKGFSPFKLGPGTKLYAAPVTAVAATTSENARDAALSAARGALSNLLSEIGDYGRPNVRKEARTALQTIDAAMRATQQEGGK